MSHDLVSPRKSMRPVEPIQTADLFPGLHDALMALLRGLRDEDWIRPTAAGT
jgi:hypothetical protein